MTMTTPMSDSLALSLIVADPSEASVKTGFGLRRRLVLLDCAAVALGWAATLGAVGGISTRLGHGLSLTISLLVLATAATIAAMASQRLYVSRVCTVRTVEVVRLGRACAAVGIGALLLPRLLDVTIGTPTAITGAVASFLLLLAGRGGYRHWLSTARREGRYVRPVVVIGDNEEAGDLCRLLDHHPELGYRLAGVIGSGAGQLDDEVEVLGDLDSAVASVQHAGITGVIIAASAIAPTQLNSLIRAFLSCGIHVHLSAGVRGIGHRRLIAQPLACEPLFYVEPLRLARWQLAVKRAIDLGLTVAGSVVVLPVLALAALAIKVEDRGPVFFKQRRIGRHGRPFTIIKLRTMVPNAEDLYVRLAETHAGRDGPLIKLANDPRRTRVGRILERASIDELPQLLNVLRGEMSLVGPRPAQASEVEQFDAELMARQEVHPGITGLWQVEARDNPHFSAYRRFDLFYLENWSVSLDLAILLATLQRVALRGVQSIFGRNKVEMAAAIERIHRTSPAA
jgi:exopolysaccharide biosynthesis polyprenyl glycosylphosphotransferase